MTEPEPPTRSEEEVNLGFVARIDDVALHLLPDSLTQELLSAPPGQLPKVLTLAFQTRRMVTVQLGNVPVQAVAEATERMLITADRLAQLVAVAEQIADKYPEFGEPYRQAVAELKPRVNTANLMAHDIEAEAERAAAEFGKQAST